MTATHTQTSDDLRTGYVTMLTIREFELAAIRGLEEKLVLGALHPYIGEEAIATGICQNLRRDDIILSTHRGHGHSIAKGAPPQEMMSELFGKADGLCGGKGGSMHVADFSVGMLGANGVVSANIVIAAGAAHEIKRQGDDRVVVCFFGDGASNRGPFLEGLNWAKVFNLPVIFVCENNQFSATTRTSALTAGDGPAVRAEALGITTIEVDGNNLSKVLTVGREAVEAVREGQGPIFIHAKTFRLTGHTAADAAPYRDSAEVDRWWGNDPIIQSRAALLESGVDSRELDEDEAGVRAQISAAYEHAKFAPFPDPANAYTDVQYAGNPEDGAY